MMKSVIQKKSKTSDEDKEEKKRGRSIMESESPRMVKSVIIKKPEKSEEKKEEKKIGMPKPAAESSRMTKSAIIQKKPETSDEIKAVGKPKNESSKVMKSVAHKKTETAEENKEDRLYKFKPELAHHFKIYDWLTEKEVKQSLQKYINQNHLYNKDKREIEFYK